MTTKDAVIDISDATNLLADEKRTQGFAVTHSELRGSSSSTRPRRKLASTLRPGRGKWWQKLLKNPLIRYTIYIIPVATLLAIPLVLFDTVYKDSRADHIRLLGLFIWIEIVWVSLWVAKLCAKLIPRLFQAVGGVVSTGVRQYAVVLGAVEVPISLFFWSIMAIIAFPIIYVFDQRYHSEHAGQILWLSILHRVLKATIGVAALYLGEKLVIQWVSVNYHQTQFYDKIHENKKLASYIELMYNISLRQFPDHHPDFMEYDLDIHDVNDLRRYSQTTDPGTINFLCDMGWFSDRITSLIGSMASDITGKQVLRPTSSRIIVECALERTAGAEALARRIWHAFTQKGAIALCEQDIVDEFEPGRERDARYIFAALDRDRNGDISLDEMVMLVKEVARDRQAMWKGVSDVKQAIKILDRLLSFLVLVVVFLIYAAFFSDFLATRYTQIWSAFTGLSFLFSATAGELFGACIFVFVKHPYDVGDRVDMDGSELEVVKISLLYTIFQKVDSGRRVQVPNSVATTCWIENVSRSKEMKERFSFAVSASTAFDDIETLQAQLQAFVEQNRRDFQPCVDVQLVSVGDLKQLDLRVEIQHKSNWHIESVRGHRRSKFMSALLSAMRKIPIEGPGGGGSSPGTASNPAYSVSVTDEQARAARAQADADRDARRLFPRNEAVRGQKKEKARLTGLTGLTAAAAAASSTAQELETLHTPVITRRPSGLFDLYLEREQE